MGGGAFLAEPRQSSFHGTGPDRLAPHRCRPFVWPAGSHARRALSRSVWLGHLLSRARGSKGWRGQCIQALSRLSRAHLGLFSPQLACFREQSCLPTCFRGLFGYKACFSRSPAKRTAMHSAKVSSIREEHLGRGREPHLLTRPSSRPLQRVDLCPQVVPNLWTKTSAFFIPLPGFALTEREPRLRS